MSSYRGFYTDGKTGHRQDISARLSATGLQVLDTDDRVVAEWPYDKLLLVEDVYRDQPVRLKEGRKGTARLTFTDQAILDDLSKEARHLKRRDHRRRSTNTRIVAWTASLGLVGAGVFFGLPYIAEPIAASLPLKWEETLGRTVRDHAMSVLAPGAPTCTRNSAGRAALDRLVARLAGTMESRYRFRVAVVDHKLANAFATPGGYILVFRGLIDKSKSPEAFAGVLAHEMGHVVERHATEAIVKAVGVGVLLGVFIGDTTGIGSAAADFAATLANKSYGRGAEREADRIGVTMLNRADIRGDGFADFFEWVAKKEKSNGGFTSYFSTHPSSLERAREVRKMATGRGPAMSADDWRALKSICR